MATADVSNPFAGTQSSPVPSSFDAVASHLDPGGNFFLYLCTEQWLSGLSRNTAGVRALLETLGERFQTESQFNATLNLTTKLILRSGLEEVTGLGASGIDVGDSIYRRRAMIHHNEDRHSGFLWRLVGAAPHTLNGLNLLPKRTEFAIFADFNLPRLVKEARQISAGLDSAPPPEGSQSIADKVLGTLGISTDELLSSWGGEFGLAVILDSTLTIPGVGPSGLPTRIPRADLILVIKLNDRLVFDRLRQIMDTKPGFKVSKSGGHTIISVPMNLPWEGDYEATVAYNGEYLVFASKAQLLRDVLAASRGELAGLIADPEFKLLSNGMPQEGNGFVYLGRQFQQLTREYRDMTQNGNSSSRASMAQIREQLSPLLPRGEGLFGVFQNTPDGWLWISQEKRAPRQLPPASGASSVPEPRSEMQ